MADNRRQTVHTLSGRAVLLSLYLLLTSCLHVQLGGAVTEASVTVTPLRQPSSIIELTGTPSLPSIRTLDGATRWDSRDDLARFVFLGNVQLDAARYNDSQLYLVTAQGGNDQDANSDNVLDAQAPQIAGQWHAIMTGAQLRKGKVSPLTEAVYRFLEPRLDQLSEAQLLAELDELARALVADVDASGSVDYLDVLAWHRHFNANRYLRDIERVNRLSDAIRAGATITDLRELSLAVLGRDASQGGAELFSLSGTITVPPTARADGDVNNEFAPLSANNSFASAQPLVSPVVVGGHVNLPGSGAPGATQLTGDSSDFYRASLHAGDRLTLVIAELATENDLDLYLYDGEQRLIDASISTTEFEQLSIPADGDYFVEVRMFDGSSAGASNYLLTLGIDSLPVNTEIRRLSDDFVPEQLLARFKNVRRVSTRARREQLTGMRVRGGLRAANLLQMQARRSDAMTARKLRTLLELKRLDRRPEVERAGLNYRVYPTAIPNDTFYPNQSWHYEQIALPDAWDLSTGAGTVVAVIDTGIRRNHPDLVGKLVAGWDFFEDDNNPEDPGDSEDPDSSSSFHGTHVAGTVAAATNNRQGVAGVAWDARIMPLRVLGPGGGTTFDVLRAVRFAAGIDDPLDDVPPAAQPADVINLSLAGGGFDSFSQDLYNQVAALGIIVVAAAGNDSSAEFAYPASYDNVISVSATDINRERALYSNFGSAVDVAAPGGDTRTNDANNDNQPDAILSTGADDSDGSPTDVYRYLQGTSMASPHVAGVVALMKSVYPALTTDALEVLLEQSRITEDLGRPGRDNNFGWGLINARRAVGAAISLLNGEELALSAELTVSASILNFGAFANQLLLTLGNDGPGELSITNITASEPWVTVTAVETDTEGLGSYAVWVDRSGLTIDTFTASITISSQTVSNANEETVVQLVVEQPDPSTFTEGNAGPHYVLLVESDSGEVFQEDAVVASQGRYQYRFENVPMGRYEIIAGSDSDNDFFICDPGESCGAWPVLDTNIPVIEVVQSLNQLDFSSSYSTGVVSTSSASAPAASLLQARRRSAYRRANQSIRRPGAERFADRTRAP